MSSILSPSKSAAAPRLLEQVRGRIRFKHYSIRTEQAYLDWIKRFIRFFGKRHPKGEIKGDQRGQAQIIPSK